MKVPSWKPIVKVFTLTLCVAAMVATPLKAADTLAVVSIKPTDRLLTDAEYVLEATGTNGIAQFVMPTIKSFLQHVDGKRPIGMVLSVDGPEFIPLGFLPVTDLDAFIEQIQEQVGPPTDAGDGIKEFQGPQQSIYVKEQNGWAFIGQNVESLSDLPKDPAKLLDGLDQKYDLAVQVHVNNVPDVYRQMAMDQIKAGLQQAQLNTDSDAAKVTREQLEQQMEAIQEMDVVTLGWQIDPEEKQTYLDMAVTATPGTKLAKQMEMAQETTKYSGFVVPDAAMSANLSAVIPADQIQGQVAAFDELEESALKEIDSDTNLTDENARKAAKQIVTGFMGIVRETMKTGKIDSCMSVILKPKAMTLVSANHVASGTAVEDAVKQLVEMAKNEPEITFSSVKFNAGEHAGVRLHTMALPIPEDEYLRQVMGDQLEIVVGASDESAYFALGTDGMDYLKKMIDASSSSGGKKLDPMGMTISVTPILEFVDSIEPNPIVASLSQSIAASEGKDRIQVKMTAIENGVTYRFAIEEGILRLIGQAVQMGGAGGF